MKNFLIAIAILAPLGCAQPEGNAERKAPPAAEQPKKGLAAVARRLECVSWDPQQKQLIWLVSVWDLESDMTKPADLERYVIHVNSGVMESNGELRRFQIPADGLQTLMNILSSYTMRSTIWWGQAGGDDSDDAPALLPGQGDPKDKRGGDPKDDKPKAATPGKAILLPPSSASPRPVISPVAKVR